MIETMCNEILGNYTKKEDQLMSAAIGTWPKRRLNRVMDALKFEYPNYERLNKGAEGAKRKRVVSVLSREAARTVKEDEKILKKRKSSPEPKVTTLKKRKAKSPRPKVTEEEEETPSTPPGPELTKLFQKKEEPLATKKANGVKKRRIGSVMKATEKTPPPISASKIAPTASTEANVEANTSAQAAAVTETANLEATLSGIEN
jgi:hypothetical protein